MVKQSKPESRFERAAVAFTEWVGSIASVVTHTILFVACFVSVWFGVPFEKMLLVLTTVVSLEAIYLAIFIQMTVNRNTQSLEEVEEDIDEIQKDVDEIQEDIDEVQKDIDEVQEDVDEIQKDVDEVQEDVEELSEDEQHHAVDSSTRQTLTNIESTLAKLIQEIEKIKAQK